MENKKFKVCMDSLKKEFTIYLSGSSFTESDSNMAIFEDETVFLYDGTSGSSGNLILNPGFDDTPLFSNWESMPLYYWELGFRDFYDNDYMAITNTFDDINWSEINTLTSASFLVIAESKYNFHMNLFEEDGLLINLADNGAGNPSFPIPSPTVNYYNYYPQVFYKNINNVYYAYYPSIYGVEIDWLNNAGTILSTDIIKDGFGLTTEINKWYIPPIGITGKIEYEYPKPKIISWYSILNSPPNAYYGKIRIYAFIDRISLPATIEGGGIGFEDSRSGNPSTGWQLIKQPIFKVDNIWVSGKGSSLINISPLKSYLPEEEYITFNTQDLFNAECSVQTTSEPIENNALSGDCCGGTDGYFSSTDYYLYIGKYFDGITYKTWVPFSPAFPSGGFSIKSAYLTLPSLITSPVITGQQTKIKISFDKLINRVTPVSLEDLNSVETISRVLDFTINEFTDIGQNYIFDITEAAKDFFGRDGVIWTSGDNCAILISDGGSYSGVTNRKQVSSHENINYEPVKLYIELENNVYTDIVRDTYINSSASNFNFKDSDTIFIGKEQTSGGTYRSLIYFDTSSIPVTSTAISASLTLYHKSPSAFNNENNGTLKIYPVSDSWDISLTTWSKRTGVDEWSSAGGYYTSISQGETAITAEQEAGAISIPISGSSVESWITSPSTNKGWILKMETESSNVHPFVSSDDNGTIYSDYKPSLFVNYTVSGVPYSKTLVKTEAPPSQDLYTKSLLHFDGNILDSSSKTWTSNGATTSTTVKKLGTGSLNLTNRYHSITTPWTTDWSIGTENFTIDFWINLYGTIYNEPDNNGYRNIWYVRKDNLWTRIYFDGRNSWNSSWNFHFDYRIISGENEWEISMPSSFRFSASRWYHLAFVRNGNYSYIFVDGIKQVTKIDSSPKNILSDSSYNVSIGSTTNGARAYIDEFRFSKGIARWISDFQIPTLPYT